ncbi:MAG: hypothetical protein WA823_06500 [Candidatus Acidiferrales bacterium]
MIGLIFSLLIALGLLIFLLLLARPQRTPTIEGSGQLVVDARGALDRLQRDLLPREFVSRLYDRRDLDFVMACTPREVQKRFLAERKRLAIAWVGRVREEIVELRRLHVGQSRLYANIGMRSEVALAFDFASFLIACRILELALRIRGPYGVPGIVRWTMGAADRLCAISEKSLELLAARVNLQRAANGAEAAS